MPKDKDPIVLCRNIGAGNIIFFPKVAGSQPGKSAKNLISWLVLDIMLLSKGQKTFKWINNRCMSQVCGIEAYFQAQNQQETPFLRIQACVVLPLNHGETKANMKMTLGAVI